MALLAQAWSSHKPAEQGNYFDEMRVLWLCV